MIRPVFERERQMGRPTVIDLREVVNALLYLTRTDCQWRLLPTDFPNWNTARYYFDHWTLDGTFVRVNDALRQRARQRAGREPEPSAGIIDSQSVKTTKAGGERGFDGEKKVTGCKQPNQHTFVAAPHTGLVERTLAILGRARRLSKDYERHDHYSEAMVYIASINSLLRRFAPDARTTTRYQSTAAAA